MQSLVSSISSLFSQVNASSLQSIFAVLSILIISFLIYFIFKLLNLINTLVESNNKLDDITSAITSLYSILRRIEQNEKILNTSLNDIKEYLNIMYSNKNKHIIVSKSTLIDSDDDNSSRKEV